MLPEWQEHSLEQVIDKNSLAAVLSSLVNICNEKAAHVRGNWQDEHLAKAWERMARRIETTKDAALCNAL